MATPVVVQQTHRFVEDDGSLTTATLLSTQGGDLTRQTGTENKVRLRIIVQETNNGNAVLPFQLRYQKNGAGGYQAITAASSNVRAVDDDNSIADDTVITTQRLTYSGTWDNGRYDDAGNGMSNIALRSEFTEIEFCFYIVYADVADTDYFDLRVYTTAGTPLDSYTDTPRLTVDKPAGTEYFQDVDGTLGLAGDPDFSVSKVNNLSGALGLAGDPSFVITKITDLIGALGLSGDVSMIKDFVRTVTGTLDLAGDPSFVITKITDLTGALGLSGDVSMIKNFVRTVTGTLNLAGNLSKATYEILASWANLLPLGRRWAFAPRLVGGWQELAGQEDQSASGELGLAGTLSRAVSTSQAGTLPSSGAMTKATSPGAYSGTLGLAGDPDFSVGKVNTIAGTLGLAGDLGDWSISKAVAGVLGLAGDLAKQTATTLSGILDLAGDLGNWSISKAVAGVLGLAGDLAKQAATDLAGTLGLAGDVAKQTATDLAGTLGLAGDLGDWSISKAVAGVLGLAGDPSFAISKITDLAGTLGLAGALETLKAFFQTVGGTLGLAGDLGNWSIYKAVAGTLGLAGDVAKQTATDLAGTLGLAGDVVKQTATDFAGTLGLAGDVVKQTATDLAGTLGLAGDLGDWSIPKAVAGVLGLAGDPSFAISKITDLAGTLGLAGALETLKAFFQDVGGTLGLAGDLGDWSIYKAVAGALDLAGDLAKQTTADFAGTLGLAGDVVKQTAIDLAGTLGLAGVLDTLKLFLQNVAGTLGLAGDVTQVSVSTIVAGVLELAGAVVKQTATALAGSIAPAGSLIRQAQVILDGVLGLFGDLATELHAGIQTFYQTCQGVLDLAGALGNFSITKGIAGTLSSAGALVKQTATTLAGTLDSSGALTALRTAYQAVAGTLGLAGDLGGFTIGKALAGTLASAGALTRKIATSLAGILGLAGSLAKDRTGLAIVTLTLYKRVRSFALAVRDLTLTLKDKD